MHQIKVTGVLVDEFEFGDFHKVSMKAQDLLEASSTPSTKETQEPTNAQGAEQPPVTSVNVKSEKNAPPSQESQTAKAPEPAAQKQAAAATTEAPKDMAKERPAPTSTPLSKLFWKKTAPEDKEVVINEKVEASLEALALDKDETKSPETAEVKPRREENKNPKTNLRKFFKLTSGSTERPVAPTESELVGQKSKESSKDKTSTTELSKQETQDQQDSREQQTTATDSIQNGGDTVKDSPLKKIEKRQSFGGFFKGLVG
ncbi:Breast carcinoma-amplified sequence 1 [Chelonia mydas]|uniref:Breast carcinoma-amplified sequence 1 n=1 Tax=Chelonia mydas TaxID=8469 RepID=M7C5J8_CHEMY|nr:Breast carcinoma-amplified sequence 1 [Chelonia mydas]